MTTRKIEKSAPKDTSLVGKVVDVAASGLDEDGLAWGYTEGKKVGFPGILPGEQARVKITHVSRNFMFAETIRILRHSPDRLLQAPCNASNCNACPLIRMKYPAQLAWKSALLANEIKRYPNMGQLNILPAIPSPKRINYRNSAKLVISGKFAAPVIGIYRRHSHEVIDIEECPLHHPLINRIIRAAKEGIRKGKVPIFSPRSGTGLLRYLVVRVSEHTEKAMVVLVTAERSYNEIHHLSKYLQGAVPEISVVAQNVNASAGNVIFGTKDFFLTKEQTLIDSIGPIRFTISPRSFFQINSGGAGIIYEKVRELAALSGTERVTDLYCGVGGISLFLAGQARDVTGIESVSAAVIDAEKNAALNDIHNCRFMSGDAAALLGELNDEGYGADLLVLNPPRKGCDERVLKQAALLAPARMIYVSCSPASLARDLSILLQSGYRASVIQPIDMFPQTPHVEHVALITRS